MSDFLSIFKPSVAAEVSNVLKDMSESTGQVAGRLNEASESMATSNLYASTYSKVLKESEGSLLSSSLSTQSMLSNTVAQADAARSFSKGIDRIQEGLQDLNQKGEAVGDTFTNQIAQQYADLGNPSIRAIEEANATISALEAVSKDAFEKVGYSQDSILQKTQGQTIQNIKAGSSYQMFASNVAGSFGEIESSHENAYNAMVAVVKKHEDSMLLLTTAQKATKIEIEAASASVLEFNDKITETNKQIADIEGKEILSSADKKKIEENTEKIRGYNASLVSTKEKLGKLEKARDRQNEQVKKSNALIDAAGKKAEKYKESSENMITSTKSLVVVSALATLAVKTFSQTQDTLIESLKASSLSSGEMSSAVTTMSQDMAKNNMSLQQGSQLYQALAEAQMLSLDPSDKLREQTIQMGRALDMSAESVVEMQLQLANVWQVGSKSIPFIGSAMVSAASSTILTRREVQGVVKDMTPFITTFPSQMRTKLVPAFLAVQAELKKSGGSAADFGSMMTKTMDMANVEGHLLQQLLGQGIPDQFANLGEMMAEDMPGAMAVMREGLSGFTTELTDSEEMLQYINRNATVLTAQLPLTVDQMKQLAMFSHESASGTAGAVSAEMQRAKALEQSYTQAQSGLTKAFNRIKASVLPIVHNVGEKIATVVSGALNGISSMLESMSWIFSSDIAGWAMIGVGAITTLTASFFSLSAGAGMVRKSFGFLSKMKPFSLLSSGASNAATDVGNASKNISKSSGSMGDAVKKNMSAVASGIKSAMSGVVDIVKDVFHGALNIVSKSSAVIKEVVVNLAGALKEGVSTAMKGVADGMNALGTVSLKAAPGIAIVSLAAIALGGALRLAAPAIESLVGGIVSIGKVIGNTLVSGLEAVSGAMVSIANVMSDTVLGLMDRMVSMGDSASGMIAAGAGMASMGVGLLAFSTSSLLAVPGLAALAGVMALFGGSAGIFSPAEKMSAELDEMGGVSPESVSKLNNINSFMDSFGEASSALRNTLIKSSLNATLVGLATFFTANPTEAIADTLTDLKEISNAVSDNAEQLPKKDASNISARINNSTQIIDAVGTSVESLNQVTENLESGGVFGKIGDFFGGPTKDNLEKTFKNMDLVIAAAIQQSQDLPDVSEDSIAKIESGKDYIGALSQSMESVDSILSSSKKFRGESSEGLKGSLESALVTLKELIAVAEAKAEGMSVKPESIEKVKSATEASKSLSLLISESAKVQKALGSVTDSSWFGKDDVLEGVSENISSFFGAQKTILTAAEKGVGDLVSLSDADITKLDNSVKSLEKLSDVVNKTKSLSVSSSEFDLSALKKSVGDASAGAEYLSQDGVLSSFFALSEIDLEQASDGLDSISQYLEKFSSSFVSLAETDIGNLVANTQDMVGYLKEFKALKEEATIASSNIPQENGAGIVDIETRESDSIAIKDLRTVSANELDAYYSGEDLPALEGQESSTMADHIKASREIIRKENEVKKQAESGELVKVQKVQAKNINDLSSKFDVLISLMKQSNAHNAELVELMEDASRT